jgi:hypothetical protein
MSHCEYFESLKTRNGEEDKNSKKIRYSAFTIWVEFIFILINLRKQLLKGRSYFKCFDTKDGKKIIEDATYDLNIFKTLFFNQNIILNYIKLEINFELITRF